MGRGAEENCLPSRRGPLALVVLVLLLALVLVPVPLLVRRRRGAQCRGPYLAPVWLRK